MNIILKFLFIYLEISWLSFLKNSFCQVKSWCVLFYWDNVARVFNFCIRHFCHELLVCFYSIRIILKKLLELFPVSEYFFILLIWWAAMCLFNKDVKIIYHDFYFILNALWDTRCWFPLHFYFLNKFIFTYSFV